MITGVTTGDLLKAWRKRIAMTQEEFAALLDRSRSTVNDYEANRVSPGVDTLLHFIAAIEKKYGSLGDSESERLSAFFAGPDAVSQEDRAERALRELRRGRRSGKGPGR